MADMCVCGCLESQAAAERLGMEELFKTKKNDVR
jgi:hypothetical protein